MKIPSLIILITLRLAKIVAVFPILLCFLAKEQTTVNSLAEQLPYLNDNSVNATLALGTENQTGEDLYWNTAWGILPSSESYNFRYTIQY